MPRLPIETVTSRAAAAQAGGGFVPTTSDASDCFIPCRPGRRADAWSRRDTEHGRICGTDRQPGRWEVRVARILVAFLWVHGVPALAA